MALFLLLYSQHEVLVNRALSGILWALFLLLFSSSSGGQEHLFSTAQRRGPPRPFWLRMAGWTAAA